MKNLFYILAASAALAAAPASAAPEVRVGGELTSLSGDPRGSARVDVSDFDLGQVGYGVEARTDFGEGVDELTARVGYTLSVGPVLLTPTAQVGVANLNDNGRTDLFGTFGAGAEARVNVLPRVDAVGSYTYRQAFEGRDLYRLNEYQVGADYTLDNGVRLGARYLNRTGTVDSEGVALSAAFSL